MIILMPNLSVSIEELEHNAVAEKKRIHIRKIERLSNRRKKI